MIQHIHIITLIHTMDTMHIPSTPPTDHTKYTTHRPHQNTPTLENGIILLMVLTMSPCSGTDSRGTNSPAANSSEKPWLVVMKPS